MAVVARSFLISAVLMASRPCFALRLQPNISDPPGTVTLESFLRVFAPRHKENPRILSTVGACPDGGVAVEFGTGGPAQERSCVGFDAVKRGARLAEAHMKARKEEYAGISGDFVGISGNTYRILRFGSPAALWADLEKFIEAAKASMEGHFSVLVKALKQPTRPLKIMAAMRFFKEVVHGSRDVHKLFKTMIGKLTDLYITLKLQLLEAKSPGKVLLKDIIEAYCKAEGDDASDKADCIAEVKDIYAFYAFAFTVADKVGSIEFDVCVGRNVVHDPAGKKCLTPPPENLKCLADERMWCGHGDDPKRFKNKDYCCCSDVDANIESPAVEIQPTLFGFGPKIKKTTERCQLHRALSLIPPEHIPKHVPSLIESTSRAFSLPASVKDDSTPYQQGDAVLVKEREAIVIKDWQDGRCGVKFLDDDSIEIVLTDELAKRSYVSSESVDPTNQRSVRIGVELFSDTYQGHFSHPDFEGNADSIPLTVEIDRDSGTASWSTNDNTEVLAISAVAGRIIFSDKDGTAFEGSIDGRGTIQGEVILDGVRGGSFTLEPIIE